MRSLAGPARISYTPLAMQNRCQSRARGIGRVVICLSFGLPFCVGCAYALVKREFPLEMRVVDQSGEPASDVEVRVVNYCITNLHGRVPHEPIVAVTDETGMARLTIKDEWCDTLLLGITVSQLKLHSVCFEMKGGQGEASSMSFDRDFAESTVTDLGTVAFGESSAVPFPAATTRDTE